MYDVLLMNIVSPLIGMLKSPRRTLTAAVADPRPFKTAAAIVLIAAACNTGFFLTRVGRLAALDQRVRQLESIGTVITDDVFARVREWERYRPIVSAVTVIVGWPLAWAAIAGMTWRFARATAAQAPTFLQVFAVIVYASAVFALRAVIVTPINYMRESVGGATSVSLLLPGLSDGSFAGRLFGALDIFVLWWTALVALGLGMLYQVRASVVARWLVGAYAAGAAALALTQALRGGV